jgi:hypothetical protein
MSPVRHKGVLDAGAYHGRDATLRVWHAYFDEFEGVSVGRSSSCFGVEDRVFLRVRERGRGRGRQSGAEVDWQRWWGREAAALKPDR